MFDAKLFSQLIKRAQGKKSLNEYARRSGVSSAYISKLKNMVNTTPPSPVIIRKLADNFNGATYAEMMAAAGHIIPLEEAVKRQAKAKYLIRSLGDTDGSPIYEEDFSILTLEEREELDELINESTRNEIIEFITALTNINDASKLLAGEEEVLALDKGGMVKIPVLGKIACGDPILSEENFEGYRYEHVSNLPKGELFILEAKGSSMEPAIPSGSFVTIRVQPDVENGEIAAVRIDESNEATLKRVKKQGNVIFLMPENKEYDPIIVTEETPITILGKAMRFSVDL